MTRTIAVDLDGVIFNLLQGLSDYIFATYQVRVVPEEVRAYQLAGLTGNDVVDNAILQFIRSPRSYFRLPVYPDAYDGLYHLKDANFKIIALTRRPTGASGPTELALADNFPGVFAKAITTKYKLRQARANRVKFAIEDHGPTAEEFAADRIWTYLVDRPYNKATRETRFLRRVPGIAAAVQHILTPIGERLVEA